MTREADDAPDPLRQRRGVQTAMTASLVARQLLLLFLLGTALLLMSLFVGYYNADQATGLYFLTDGPRVDLKYFVLPLLVVMVYGYVLLMGLLFALGPSERTFRWFFATMMGALLVANYDQSILDWFLRFFAAAALRPQNVVSAMKILFAGLFFLVLIIMHYNILADDFARRLLRRGVPTEEVARIRPNMFKVLVPAILTAGGVAFGLALLGEAGALLFQQGGLLIPKVQLLLLAALVVPMAYLVRGILRDLAQRRAPPPPAGPNR